MKKDELKKAFDKEFINITVSPKLKEKTLENIKASYIKKNSHIPYLKNFAAIFVVTMLCVSIYFTRNIPKNNNLESTNEQIVLDTLEDSEPSVANFESDKKERALFMAPANLESINYGILNDCSETQEVASITSEEDFLKLYPNAEKLENGYKIYENGKEVIYIFENGFLKNTIIQE